MFKHINGTADTDQKHQSNTFHSITRYTTIWLFQINFKFKLLYFVYIYIYFRFFLNWPHCERICCAHAQVFSLLKHSERITPKSLNTLKRFVFFFIDHFFLLSIFYRKFCKLMRWCGSHCRIYLLSISFGTFCVWHDLNVHVHTIHTVHAYNWTPADFRPNYYLCIIIRVKLWKYAVHLVLLDLYILYHQIEIRISQIF